MIIHSIIPQEIIFGNDYKTNECMEIDYLGEKVLVYCASNNEYIIRRILSTSPQAYLNPRLQPGSIIRNMV